ncbi:MAG: tetratricopeptide repeat protein [Desulfovibrio sp.]|nr:tetratricopeptide repeat protein [Desulfovibrio sp.]
MKKEAQNLPNDQGLLGELGSEVSQESAPLLEFITRHGGLIAGFVLVFLLLTGLTALWQWHSNKEANSYLTQMAMITQKDDKALALTSLEQLAKEAPNKLKTLTYLTLGDLALQSKDLAKAQAVYKQAAAEDADGVSGTMAQYALIASFLRDAKYTNALEAIEALWKQYGTNQPLLLQQLKAETLARTGDTKQAHDLFVAISKTQQGVEAAYFLARAKAIGEQEGKQTTQP